MTDHHAWARRRINRAALDFVTFGLWSWLFGRI